MKTIAKQFTGWLFVLAMLACGVAQAAEKNDYVLGAGDVIRIVVFQNPDLTLETRVSESGDITYPLIGQVSVGGLAIFAAEQKIAKQLRDGGFVLQPQVNINIVQVRGNQIAVLGQVGRPGRYPLELANTKLSDILAMAGGINAGGADTVTLVGQRAGKQIRKEIDIPGMFQSGKLDDDIPVAGGDIIYVQRAPMFYIYGEVQRPGTYRLERDMTVMQALVLGGGVGPRGTERGMKLHRRDGDGKLRVIEPALTDPMKSDDVIYVRESVF